MASLGDACNETGKWIDSKIRFLQTADTDSCHYCPCKRHHRSSLYMIFLHRLFVPFSFIVCIMGLKPSP